jgi:SAM-dependent methyltransferase
MGDGPLRQHPRIRANPSIQCTGRVSEIEKKAFLTDLLALIQPSRLESFSLVTLEAWSVKTPAIVHADCAATRELITLSRGGIAIRSAQEFIETVDTLWNDHYLAGYLGESGFKFAQENYRWHTIANRFLEARASIMGYPNHYRKPSSADPSHQTILDLPSTPKQIEPLHVLKGRVLRPSPGSATQKFNRYLGHDFYAQFEAFFRDPSTPVKAMPSWSYYANLARDMKSDQVWVDIGAGRGHFLDFLLQQGVSHHQLFGVEPDPGSYKEIRQKPYPSCSMLADAFLMQLEDESLDFISMLHVAEHIPWEDFCVIVALAYRRLKKGGRIIVEVPNINTIKTAATNFWLDPTHIRPLVRETLVFLLLHCHFMEVETHSYASHLPDDRMQQLKDTLGDPLIVDEIYGHQDLCVTGIKI